MSASESLPRLYALGAKAALALPQAEQDAIWKEYAEFWGGPVTAGMRAMELQAEYQADFLEERDGTYR